MSRRRRSKQPSTPPASAPIPDRVDEDHQREQYFFDRPTVARLADMVDAHARPVCLCVPMVARELARRGRAVKLLDVDARFAQLPGFTRWDLYRPSPLPELPDLVLSDPPFTLVRLSQLFTAIHTLCRGELRTRVAIVWPTARALDITGTFAPFGLRATGFEPGYVSVRPIEENRASLFANFELDPRWGLE